MDKNKSNSNVNVYVNVRPLGLVMGVTHIVHPFPTHLLWRRCSGEKLFRKLPQLNLLFTLQLESVSAYRYNWGDLMPCYTVHVCTTYHNPLFCDNSNSKFISCKASPSPEITTPTYFPRDWIIKQVHLLPEHLPNAVCPVQWRREMCCVVKGAIWAPNTS